MAVFKVKKGETIYDIAARTGQPVSKLFRYFGTDRPRKGVRYNTRTLAGMKAGTGQAWGRAVGQGATITGESAGQAMTFADLLAQEAGLTPTPQPTTEETITATTQTTPTTTTTPPPLSFAPGGVQVKPGETFLDVANRLGVDVTDLLESNAGVRQLHPGTFLQRPMVGGRPQGAIGTRGEKPTELPFGVSQNFVDWLQSQGAVTPAETNLPASATAPTGTTPETVRPPARSPTRMLDKEQMVTDRISTTPTLAGQPELYVVRKLTEQGQNPPDFITGNTASQLGYTKERLTMAGYYQDANGNWIFGGPQTMTTNLGGGTTTRRRYASGGGRRSGGKTLYQGVVDSDFMWRASFRV